jgi:Holliday junction resolvase
MTAYTIGRQFEYQVLEYFRELAYFAIRSPGSKTKIDIIAIKPHQVLFIQCKRAGTLGPAEWNQLFAIASTCGAIPIVASKIARKPIVFEQLMALKDGSGRAQPKRVWLASPS